MNYRYIVVEGAIGTGKSELAEKLAFFLGGLFIQEHPEHNPFLLPFLQHPEKNALAAELQFLLLRADLLTAIKTAESKNEALMVSDFLVEKDKIYAPLVLKEEELNLYWQLRRRIMPEIIKPDLIILLESSLEKTYSRLESKNNGKKELYPALFVEQVHAEYQRFFYIYDDVPILIANIEGLDFIDNDDHFNLLLKTMTNLTGKTNYLNIGEKI